MDNLPKDLRIKAGMIEMCEKIPFGSDSALMYQAADEIEQLKQRNAELMAQVNKLRVSATIVLNARDKDGITTSGLLKKFNGLSEALSFLPDEYLAEHDREVAARAVEAALNLYAKAIYESGELPFKQAEYIVDSSSGFAEEYANKIKSGEVEV